MTLVVLIAKSGADRGPAPYPSLASVLLASHTARSETPSRQIAIEFHIPPRPSVFTRYVSTNPSGSR